MSNQYTPIRLLIGLALWVTACACLLDRTAASATAAPRAPSPAQPLNHPSKGGLRAAQPRWPLGGPGGAVHVDTHAKTTVDTLVSTLPGPLLRRDEAETEQIEALTIGARSPASVLARADNEAGHAAQTPALSTPAPAGIHPRANGTFTLFVPVVWRPRLVSGRVTLNGMPAASEPVELRLLDSTVMSTTSDQSGFFAFYNPPLSQTSSYYVRYYNRSMVYNGRLAAYLTTSFTLDNGRSVDVGSFDIADVMPIAPAHDATVTLPQTFSWARRAPALAGADSYTLEMEPVNTAMHLYRSDALGYADSTVLAARPFEDGANTQTYRWGVEVRNPGPADNLPLGLSYYLRTVTISR